MPIFEPGTWLGPDGRVDGLGTVSAGRFAIALEGARFDRHHHDDDEIWFIADGKALMLVDGEERYVQTGDIVVHPAGTTHDIVAVYEPIRGFFTETGHPTGGRHGHLHRASDDAAGHDVPALPLPADFPTR